MKKTIFNKLLLVVLFLVGVSSSAQVRVKTNKGRSNKKVVKKTNRGNHSYHNNNRQNVRVKTNRNRVVVSKPKRPRAIVKRPSYKRSGYVWVQGYWKWNVYYGKYIWQKARWKRVKPNHMWVPGFWEISPGGFFWVEGYWALKY